MNQTSQITNRIFCIGLNKTGTSSMNHCFKILGLHPIAAPTVMGPEIRKKIKQFYKDQHYTPLLDVAENYKSFEDRPWNMWEMYQHLDRRFPDSRFILTVRDPESWWRSTERWVKIQKPHILERYLQHFEAKEFSHDAMIERYQKYNDDVIRYFKGTGKLLVLNLEEGDGWTELCTFLNEPTPSLPFPHANRQAYTKQDLTLMREFRRKEKGITCQACQKSFLISSPSKNKKGLPLFKKINKGLGRRTRIKNRAAGLIRKMHQHSGFNHASLKLTAWLNQLSDEKKTQQAEIHQQYSDLRTDNFAVVSCLFNPNQSQRRIDNFKEFLAGIKNSGVHCLVVELAFGSTPFAIDPNEQPVIQLRTHDIMWQKERLLNIGIQRLLDEGFEKIAWLDGDITFEHPEWPRIIAAKLESANLCQVFSTVSIQGEPGRAPQLGASSIKYFKKHNRWFSQQPITSWGFKIEEPMGGQSGFGWAARADVLRKVPLFESAIVGGADKMMLAASLAGEEKQSTLKKLTVSHKSCPKCGHRNRSDRYIADFLEWADQWFSAVDGKVDYAPLHIQDMYHGSRTNRKYMKRRDILYKHQYDPKTDITIGADGPLAWASDKFGLHQDITAYFLSRQDDA